MEEHLINIDRLADNLILLSAAFSEFRPNAEGTVLCIGVTLKRKYQGNNLAGSSTG